MENPPVEQVKDQVDVETMGAIDFDDSSMIMT
jgi:hypothetical protein